MSRVFSVTYSQVIRAGVSVPGPPMQPLIEMPEPSGKGLIDTAWKATFGPAGCAPAAYVPSKTTRTIRRIFASLFPRPTRRALSQKRANAFLRIRRHGIQRHHFFRIRV